MGRILRGRVLRLRPSILTAFVVLTVPVLFAVIAVTYVSNENTARDDATELIERYAADAIENIQSDFNPLRSMIRAAAVLGAEQPDFYFDDRSLKYFFSMLQHSDKIVAVYAGLHDGSFRQARRADPEVPVFDKSPPPETRYAYRTMSAMGSAGRSDRYVFLNGGGKEIGSVSGPTTYDPRARFWYRTAVAAGTVVISDPDIFAVLGLIGITVAAPFKVDDQVRGVVTIDITLEGMAEYLAERRISPGTRSFMLDHQGHVIAASDSPKTYTNVRGRLELSHVTSLDDHLAAVAFGSRPRTGATSYAFSYEGKEYLASLSSMPESFGKRWQLFIITPLEDFTSRFTRNNNILLAIGLGATVLQILVIYLLTSAVSAPLERLAHRVDRIQELKAHDVPPIKSPIREISVLSRAIETLDTAVASFAAFVPVGLVRQLLDSDQKLQLGGHSRFLTIFFTDLEGFSTLSETIPSQELVLRVSAYLEVVSRSVDQEQGTIDKFIGDGVMAFWGAPALLDDHAYRACVAAMRIERGMDELNERWRQEGLRPFRVRIGIHSDAVLVGNIGSKERMSYTVVGDGVNVAARLEGINKEFGTRVCISHSVFKEAGDRLCVRPIDEVTVKGRRTKVPIYELLGAYGSGPDFEPTPDEVGLCQMTRSAYEALMAEDHALALQRYREILKLYPDDPVARQIAHRLGPTLAASA
jgi:adenylate cyclase